MGRKIICPEEERSWFLSVGRKRIWYAPSVRMRCQILFLPKLFGRDQIICGRKRICPPKLFGRKRIWQEGKKTLDPNSLEKNSALPKNLGNGTLQSLKIFFFIKKIFFSSSPQTPLLRRGEEGSFARIWVASEGAYEIKKKRLPAVGPENYTKFKLKIEKKFFFPSEKKKKKVID